MGRPPSFRSAGTGQDHSQGYDAFVRTPNRFRHLAVRVDGPRFLSVVLFTCKCFDTQQAVAATHDFFAMSKVAHQEF